MSACWQLTKSTHDPRRPLRPLESPRSRYKASSTRDSDRALFLGAASVATSTRQSRTVQPWPCLAQLPFDVLHLIGEHLRPLISPFANPTSWSGVSSSSSWIDHGQDLIDFSSTCRAVHSATRSLIGRTWGFHRIESNVASEVIAARQRLGTIETIRNAASDGARRLVVDATRIRHFYLRLNRDSSFLLNVTCLLLDKLSLMSNLESVALIFTDVSTVVSTAPYSVATLPPTLIESLARLAHLRELYLCGLKIPTLESSLKRHPFQFEPEFRTLVANACHDSILNLVPLVARTATHFSLWRDFAQVPEINPEEWWKVETWGKLEHVELFGFATTGRRARARGGNRFIETWLDSLLARPIAHLDQGSLTTTSSSTLHLRSLSLPEPFRLEVFLDRILPALSHLRSCLKAFTISVWNDPKFGPNVLEEVHQSLPELEQLGLGVDTILELRCWRGDVNSYAASLRLFTSLTTLTWNYCPYSNLSPSQLIDHVTRPLLRSICSPTSCHSSSLSIVRWFPSCRVEGEFRRRSERLGGEVLEWSFERDEKTRRGENKSKPVLSAICRKRGGGGVP